MAKYAQLQAAWKVLGDAHQKAVWIKDNRKDFEELGLKIGGAKDAENAFVGDTGTVVESFKARTKAAACLAQLTEEYQMDLADEIACGNALEVSRQHRKQIEAGIAVDTKRFQTAKPLSGTDKGDTKGVLGTDGIIEGTKSYAGLTHNIGVYKKQLEAADPANQPLIASLCQQVALVEQAVQVAVDAAKGWDLRDSGTIEEVNEVLSRQQRLRGKTTAENLGQADMEIKCLQALKAQMERDAETPVPIESIRTYGQLDDALRIYNGRLREAAEDECAQIQAQIGELKKSRKKWDGTLEAMKKPGFIGTLNPIQDLDDAIIYYGNLQKRQVTDEIAAHAAGHRRIGKEARGSATPHWIAADARGNR